ncbi:15-cis-zeta-carotene isomerase, chloroplastic [Ziziphus jujuba]|uniref:15-cis-zeta-carotene isomerase, chloroplastic n=1 Tax=Ziziphus jujuba TaxID=326968 RepID=A0A6P4A1D9_ZIZJJ|nr:15-cis-zeta-carotene isomerase, chloroplastic [Ziziphus jujuba]
MAFHSALALSIPFSFVPCRSNHQTLGVRTKPSLALFKLVNPLNAPRFGAKPTGFSSNPTLFLRRFRAGSSLGDAADDEPPPLVGEDSAVFELAKQKIASWVYFSVILGTVLYVLDVVWIDNSTGFGKAFIDAVSGLSDGHEVVMLILIMIFATVHSGLASLRDLGEQLIGERAFRVLFAGISLPLAVSTIVYFINHRYDGQQLWMLQNVPGVHQLVWLSSFISFFFLYPSTFNLLEVAAVDKPKMHLWETGIMRITRHPQMVGQVIWCLAHTVWIGNSVAVAASIGLIGHHLFGAWNGDRRLALRYGEDFEVVKSRTSIIPFAAILDGRQKLPKEYYKEFFRLPYLAITALTLGAYFAHPLMQVASFQLHS